MGGYMQALVLGVLVLRAAAALEHESRCSEADGSNRTSTNVAGIRSERIDPPGYLVLVLGKSKPAKKPYNGYFRAIAIRLDNDYLIGPTRQIRAAFREKQTEESKRIDGVFQRSPFILEPEKKFDPHKIQRPLREGERDNPMVCRDGNMTNISGTDFGYCTLDYEDGPKDLTVHDILMDQLIRTPKFETDPNKVGEDCELHTWIRSYHGSDYEFVKHYVRDPLLCDKFGCYMTIRSGFFSKPQEDLGAPIYCGPEGDKKITYILSRSISRDDCYVEKAATIIAGLPHYMRPSKG